MHVIDTNLSFLTFLRDLAADRNAWRAGLWPAGRMLDTPVVNVLCISTMKKLCNEL